jgi:NADH-quinone oxidoreductase subunit I
MVTGGILQGLMVTLRHLAEARNGANGGTRREGNEVVQTPRESGIFTVQYPEERLKVPQNFRYFPMLLYDGETGQERCTSCGICAKVCPPQCIWIVRDSDEKGKPIPEPKEFTIDASICMQCGYCAEYCPFDAIKMDHVYELATDERVRKLIWNKQDLMKSTAYYAQLHPADWAAEEAERRQKEEAERKKAEARAAAPKAAAAASKKPAPSTPGDATS